MKLSYELTLISFIMIKKKKFLNYISMDSKSCRHILRLLESLSPKVDIINLHN